jgi:hypothetical protein
MPSRLQSCIWKKWLHGLPESLFQTVDSSFFSYKPRRQFPCGYIPLNTSYKWLKRHERKALRPFVVREYRSETIMLNHRDNSSISSGSRPLAAKLEDVLLYNTWRPNERFVMKTGRLKHSIDALYLGGIRAVECRHRRNGRQYIDFQSWSRHAMLTGNEITVSNLKGVMRRPLTWRKFFTWRNMMFAIMFLLSIVALFLYFFGTISFGNVDRHLCPVIPERSIHCDITPNPDVAGIGVSMFHGPQCRNVAELLVPLSRVE